MRRYWILPLVASALFVFGCGDSEYSSPDYDPQYSPLERSDGPRTYKEFGRAQQLENQPPSGRLH